MSERLRHPILSAKLAWTDRRIAATEKTQSQADRIMSLPQAPHHVKEEAIVNWRRSGERLFDLRGRRDRLVKKINHEHPTVTPPTKTVFRGAANSGFDDGDLGSTVSTPNYRASWSTGGDVFGGYDLGQAKTKSVETVGFPKGKLESYNREIPNLEARLHRLATVVNSPLTSARQKELTQLKIDRMNIRLQLLSSKREALINKNR